MKKLLMVLSFCMFFLYNPSFGATAVKAPGFTKCKVNAAYLNIRCGPSKNYTVVKTVKYGTELKAIGKVSNWYIVQADDDTIGMVSGWYITPLTYSTMPSPAPSDNTVDISNLAMTSDEETIFNLVNDARKATGLSELKLDKEMLRVARIKSQDMVNNSYFSHTSPTYGTPFQMLKNFGINYTSAGENIAGNSTAKAAFDAWMKSSGHKANILGSNYSYTGIGVVTSPVYGKILTQMFVGR